MLTFAQISDCHLYATSDALHHSANVYLNLTRVLNELKHNTQLDGIIFTGDLTQDHTPESYQQFVNAWHSCEMTLPLFFLAGNHDDTALLERYLAPLSMLEPSAVQSSGVQPSAVQPTAIQSPKRKTSVLFTLSTTEHESGKQTSIIETQHWQFHLLNSKSETPAGMFEADSFSTVSNPLKNQFVFMHHHPIDVGYFIDDHGLQNKNEFWQSINEVSQVKGIACGHIHRGLTLTGKAKQGSINQESKEVSNIPVFTCPATSIQFDPAINGVSSTGEGPGYRIFEFADNGNVNTHLAMMPFKQ